MRRISMVSKSTPKVGDTLIIRRKEYIVLKEKGELLYATCSADTERMLYIIIKQTTVIKTKVPAGIFRLTEANAAKFSKEVTVDEKNIYIWGIPFVKLNNGSYSGGNMSFRVQYRKVAVSLDIEFTKLTLNSATA